MFTQHYHNDSTQLLDPVLLLQHVNAYHVQHERDLFTVSSANKTSSNTHVAHLFEPIEENEEEELFSTGKKLNSADRYFISFFFPEKIEVTHSLTDLLIPFYDHFAHTLIEEVYLLQSVFRL